MLGFTFIVTSRKCIAALRIMRVLRLFGSKELGRKNCLLSRTLIHFEAFNLFEWVEKDSALMPVNFCGSWIQAIDV